MSEAELGNPAEIRQLDQGGRIEIFYVDDTKRPVGREKATRAVVLEYNGNGEVIRENFGYLLNE